MKESRPKQCEMLADMKKARDERERERDDREREMRDDREMR